MSPALPRDVPATRSPWRAMGAQLRYRSLGLLCLAAGVGWSAYDGPWGGAVAGAQTPGPSAGAEVQIPSQAR